MLTRTKFLGRGGPATSLRFICTIPEPEKFSETLLVPFEFGKQKAWLHENGVVINETFSDIGYKFDVIWSAKQKAKYYSFTS